MLADLVASLALAQRFHFHQHLRQSHQTCVAKFSASRSTTNTSPLPIQIHTFVLNIILQACQP